MPVVHAVWHLSKDTFCGVKLVWKDGKPFSAKTGKPVLGTRLRKYLTCKKCDRSTD